MNSLFQQQDLDQELRERGAVPAGLHKHASEAMLPEDPNKWPLEIQQEVYKQVPYVGDFDVEVVMQRVVAEAGAGFGHVMVRPKSEVPLGEAQEDLLRHGIRVVRIPVIIKDRKLQPLDLLILDDSSVRPLTEQRLREATFRPQMFDRPAKDPGDRNLASQLYPPYRESASFGAGYKFASETPLDGLLGRTGPQARQGFWKVAAPYQIALAQNPAAAEPLHKIASATHPEPTVSDEMIRSAVRPTMAVLEVRDGSYLFKTGSSRAWDPVTHEISRGEALRLLGEKVVEAADRGNAVVASLEPVLDQDLELSDISEPGVYEVEDLQGERHQGYGFPSLLSATGEQSPVSLFWNQESLAIQPAIQGKLVQPAPEAFQPLRDAVPERPMGLGVFIDLGQSPKCFGPMLVQGVYQMPGEPSVLQCRFYSGEELEVVRSPNLQVPVGIDGRVLIPQSWRWYQLPAVPPTALLGGQHLPKEASAQVSLRAMGYDRWSLSGQPVEKLAGRESMTSQEVLEVVASLGGDPDRVIQELVRSQQHRDTWWPVKVARELVPFELSKTASQNRRAEMYLQVQDLLHPERRQDVVKLAAIAPDTTSVDHLLSLGFINQDNLESFLSYLPGLETTLFKLCELLLTSRLGLQRLPVLSLERGIRSLEDLVQAMKAMAFQE